jgi:hypothetical protein
MSSSVTAGEGEVACAGGGGGSFFSADAATVKVTVNQSAKAVCRSNFRGDMVLL